MGPSVDVSWSNLIGHRDEGRWPRRNMEPAFKLEVVKMIAEQGLSVSQVCKDLDLTDSAVRKWF